MHHPGCFQAACAQDQEMIYEHISGSLSRLFLLLSLLCPAPLCRAPRLAVNCVFTELPHPWAERAGWQCCSPSPSPVCSSSPTLAFRALRVPFQAGTKMGHGATRISAPSRRSMWIEYSSGTGCSCGKPKILTSSAGKGNVSCYSVLFSLYVCLLFMFLIPLLKGKKKTLKCERSQSFEDDGILSQKQQG